MRFGICAHPHSPQTWIKSVKLMEKEGFDSVLVPEFGRQRDIFALSTLAAVETTSIRIGLFSIPYIRHPVVIASGVATVDEVSNGRAFMILGLGGFMALKPLGIKTWKRPIATLRESVRITRELYRGDSVHFDGKMFSPKGVKLEFTARKDISIYIAAMAGDKILQLAGEVADGVLLAGPYGRYTRDVIEKVKKGAITAGRDPNKLEIAMNIIFLVSKDGEKAVNAIKPFVAREIVLDPRLRPIIEAEGVDIEGVRQAIQKGESGADLITDEMVDAFAVAGSPDHCVERIRELGEVGVDEVIPVSPWALVPPEPLPDKVKMLGRYIIPAFR